MVEFSAAPSYYLASATSGGNIMILGMTTANFTVFHTALSLIGIVSGLVVVYGMLGGKLVEKWTALFVLTTLLTCLTGYFFPVEHLLPSHIVGAITLVALAGAVLARHAFHLEGGWRRTYVLTALLALYLNCFVLVVQLFLKVPSLHAMAPKGQEPPFLIAQLVLLGVFIWLAIAAVKGFRTADRH
jgi:hypothetical protein